VSYIGWIGNAFVIAGCYGIGNKWRHAFLLTAVGEVVWIATAMLRGQYDLAAICVVFGVLAVRNWWLWGNDDARSLDRQVAGPRLLPEYSPGSVPLAVRTPQLADQTSSAADRSRRNGDGCTVSRYERYGEGGK
jgi:hypothetical protein